MYIYWRMTVKFLKDITIDWFDNNDNWGDITYHRNDTIEALEVLPISSTFSNIMLLNQTLLIDIRNDWFSEVIE
jgi:hypothetical protein